MLYSVVIWLEAPLEPQIQKYRVQWDPHVQAIAAHITVAFPNEIVVPEAVVVNGLKAGLSQIPPFRLTLHERMGYKQLSVRYPVETATLIERFPDCRNMIAIGFAQGNDRLLEIRQIAAEFLAQDELINYPHYTALAHALNDDEYDRLLQSTDPFWHDELEVTRIELLKQLPDLSWIQVYSHTL